MKVAFIGLGHVGAPMSRNILAAGHDLVVHDLRRDAVPAVSVCNAQPAAPQE